VVFIIGIRKDLNISFSFPKETHTEQGSLETKTWIPLGNVITQLAIDEKKYYFSERAVQGREWTLRNRGRSAKRWNVLKLAGFQFWMNTYRLTGTRDRTCDIDDIFVDIHSKRAFYSVKIKRDWEESRGILDKHSYDKA